MKTCLWLLSLCDLTKLNIHVEPRLWLLCISWVSCHDTVSVWSIALDFFQPKLHGEIPNMNMQDSLSSCVLLNAQRKCYCFTYLNVVVIFTFIWQFWVKLEYCKLLTFYCISNRTEVSHSSVEVVQEH
jgi:hypothetical protein